MTDKVEIQITGDPTGGVNAFTKVGAAGQSTMARLKAANDSISESTEKLMGRVTALSSSVAAAAFLNGVRAQLEYADAMDETAQKAMVTTEEFSAMAYASKFAGIEAETLVKAYTKVTDVIYKAASGDKAMKGLLVDTLQVQVRKANGELQGADEGLMQLIDRISQIENETQRVNTALDVFGNKLGPELLPLINLTRAGVERLREEAAELGKVVSSETGAAAGDLKDNLDRLRAAQDGVYMQIMQHMLPGLLRLSQLWLDNSRNSGIFTGSLKTMGTALKEALGFGEMNTLGRQAQYASARAAGVVREIERLNALIAENGPRASIEAAYGHPAMLASERVKQLRAEYDAWMKQAQGASAKLKGTADQNDGRSSTPAADTPKSDAALQAALAARLDKQRQDNEKKNNAEAARAANELRKQQRDAYEDRVGQLRLELAQWRNNTDEQRRLAERIADEAKRMFGEKSKEYAAAQQELVRIDQRAAEQRKQIEDQLREGQMQARLAVIEEERAQADQDLALGVMTMERRLALEAGFEERMMAVKRQALVAKLEMLAQDPDMNPVERARIQQQLEELERQHQARMGEIKHGQEGERARPGLGVMGGLEQQLEQAGNSLLTGQQSVMGALKQLWSGTYAAFVSEMITKPLAAWVAGQARMTLATIMGINTRTAAEVAGAATSKAVTGESVISVIAMKAYEAAASVYASIAAIPYVGPFLAPAMAAGALGVVMGMASNIFSAAGGFDIPAGVNPIVQAHAREMILPAKYADVIRTMAESGGGFAGGGGDTWVIQAMDARSMQRFMRGAGGDQFMREVSLRKRSNRAG